MLVSAQPTKCLTSLRLALTDPADPLGHDRDEWDQPEQY